MKQVHQGHVMSVSEHPRGMLEWFSAVSTVGGLMVPFGLQALYTARPRGYAHRVYTGCVYI